VASQPGEAPAPAPDDAEQHRFSMPFINYRFYNMEDFTLDFYYDTEADNYVEQFFKEWRRSMRDPHMKMGDGLRSTPFYFTECPGCGLSILTNRDHGKGLRCRACETYHHTAAVQREELGGLLGQINERLGANALRMSRPVHVLFVQLLDEERLPEAAEICRGAGFKQLEANHPMTVHMFMEGRKRNLAVSGKAYTVWERAAGSQELSWREATPREVNEVVRRIRMLDSGVRTLSTTYDASDESLLGLSMQGRHEEIEEILRKDLAEDLGNVGALLGLIEILIHQGKFEEARDKAQAATLLSPDDPGTWLALARSEMRLANFEEARDAFEESLTMDPTNRTALIFLADCYSRLGDDGKAASLRRRAESLGGLSDLL
jgi:tetratricopeptide (TPR) repeat protein